MRFGHTTVPLVLNSEKLGSLIKARRNELGLSLAELAKKLKVTSPYLSKIEKGDLVPSVEKLINIAVVLKVNVCTFLCDSHEAPTI